MIDIPQAQFDALISSVSRPDIKLLPADDEGWVIIVHSNEGQFRLSRARGGPRVWRSLDRAIEYLGKHRFVASMSVNVSSQGALDV